MNKRRVSVNDLAAAYCSPVQQGLTADMQIPLVACPSVPLPPPLDFSARGHTLQTRFHAELALAETRRLALYARSGHWLRLSICVRRHHLESPRSSACNADMKLVPLRSLVKGSSSGIFMAVVPTKKKATRFLRSSLPVCSFFGTACLCPGNSRVSLTI